MMSFSHLGIVHAQIGLILSVLLGGSITVFAQPASIWNYEQWPLWRIEIDGTNLNPLDQTPGNRCGSPIWSPDGKYIVYDITDASISPRIVVIHSDGTKRQVLGHGAMPCWSPDGKLILFQSGGKLIQIQSGGKAFMDADGRGTEILPGPSFSPRWSPRDNLIASLQGPEATAFSLFDLATGEESQVSTGKYPIYHSFDFSSDGQKICFGSSRAGLCVATLDSRAQSAKMEVLVNSGIGFHASWSPDDSQIVFAWQQSPPSGLIQIYVYDIKSGGPPKLLPGLDVKHHNVNPAWSPDGRTIAFSCPANK
jgi:Tol biopolymer transport system component